MSSEILESRISRITIRPAEPDQIQAMNGHYINGSAINGYSEESHSSKNFESNLSKTHYETKSININDTQLVIKSIHHIEDSKDTRTSSQDNGSVWNIRSINEVNEVMESELQIETSMESNPLIKSQDIGSAWNIDSIKEVKEGLQIETLNGVLESMKTENNHNTWNIDSVNEVHDTMDQEIRVDSRLKPFDSASLLTNQNIWNVSSINEVHGAMDSELQIESIRECTQKMDDYLDSQIMQKMNYESFHNNNAINEPPIYWIQAKDRHVTPSEVRLNNLKITEDVSKDERPTYNSKLTEHNTSVTSPIPSPRTIHHDNQTINLENIYTNNNSYMNSNSANKDKPLIQYRPPPMEPPKIEIESSKKLMNDHEIRSEKSNSITLREEWIEYHKVPFDSVLMELEASNFKKLTPPKNFVTPINNKKPVKSDFVSKEDHRTLFQEQQKPAKSDFISMEDHRALFQDRPKDYSLNLESEIKPVSMTKKNETINYDKLLERGDEESKKLPIRTTTSRRKTGHENDADSKAIIDISNYFTYLYEDQDKTKKLQESIDYTDKAMSMNKSQILKSIEAMSQMQSPMEFSTDCLKQTINIDRTDEELVKRPIIYDARGDQIRNLSETENFKSITEFVTLQVYQSKALVKIEITVEMFHNSKANDAWRRKNVTLTRQIELDLSKIRDGENMKQIMKQCNFNEPSMSWTDERGNTVVQYKNEKMLKGKDTFNMFSNLMALTRDEVKRFKSDNSSKDGFYLASGSIEEMQDSFCEPEYLMAGMSNQDYSCLLY